MAITKAKRSVRKKQLALSSQQSAKSITNLPTHQPTKSRAVARFRKLVHFPQAKGKTIEDVEFSTAPGYHNISINFQDQTSLNFSIETGFTLETDYSDWKSGNQRVLRQWPLLKQR